MQDNIWKKTLAQIEIKLNDESLFNRFFKFTTLLSIENQTAKIGTWGTFANQILSTKYKSMIIEILSFVYGKKLKIEFNIDKKMQELQSKDKEEVIDEIDVTETPLLQIHDDTDISLSIKLKKSGIDLKHSFSNFIVGSSNQLAHAAAKASSVDSRTFNPLFIYGKTGLGKTHLAHAVGRSIVEKDLSSKVLYVASETFLNELVSSIRTNKTLDFKKKYRELDTLIIDDIQMISKWVATQDEFFNTFNTLQSAGKLVILISDRPPEEIENLEQRLRSRFQGGMSVVIENPDLETRLAILNSKQIEFGTKLSQTILRDIAKLVNENIRELEGALNKVALMQSLKPEKELRYDEIQTILNKTAKEKRKEVKPMQVMEVVAAHYEIKVSELKSARRTANLALARQICMYIFAEEFRYKLEDIARFLNKKDHTTVLHGRDKVKQMIEEDGRFQKEVEGILNDILD